jgi:hypothetical protein
MADVVQARAGGADGGEAVSEARLTWHRLQSVFGCMKSQTEVCATLRCRMPGG